MTETLFEVNDPPPKRRVVSNGSTQPVWSRYHSERTKRPHKCDHCMANMVDDPSAPAARLARYRRKTNDGDLYLCVPHTNDQRVVDGLEVIKR